MTKAARRRIVPVIPNTSHPPSPVTLPWPPTITLVSQNILPFPVVPLAAVCVVRISETDLGNGGGWGPQPGASPNLGLRPGQGRGGGAVLKGLAVAGGGGQQQEEEEGEGRWPPAAGTPHGRRSGIPHGPLRRGAADLWSDGPGRQTSDGRTDGRKVKKGGGRGCRSS